MILLKTTPQLCNKKPENDDQGPAWIIVSFGEGNRRNNYENQRKNNQKSIISGSNILI